VEETASGKNRLGQTHPLKFTMGFWHKGSAVPTKFKKDWLSSGRPDEVLSLCAGTLDNLEDACVIGQVPRRRTGCVTFKTFAVRE